MAQYFDEKDMSYPSKRPAPLRSVYKVQWGDGVVWCGVEGCGVMWCVVVCRVVVCCGVLCCVVVCCVVLYSIELD